MLSSLHVGPQSRRQVAAPRKNPLSVQHLTGLNGQGPALADSSAVSGASSNSGSPALSDSQDRQPIAEPEEGAWEHILPAAADFPSAQALEGEPDLNELLIGPDSDSSSGQSDVLSSRPSQQSSPQEQRSSGGGAHIAPNGAPEMTREQRDERAAFVARTNDKLAQAAGSPGLMQKQQSNVVIRRTVAVLQERRRRLMGLKMHELRSLCKQEGVAMHGNKAVIAQRLLECSPGNNRLRELNVL